MKGQKISFFNPYEIYKFNGKHISISDRISRQIAKDKKIMDAPNRDELIGIKLNQIFEDKWTTLNRVEKRQIAMTDPATHCPLNCDCTYSCTKYSQEALISPNAYQIAVKKFAMAKKECRDCMVGLAFFIGFGIIGMAIIIAIH
jgi:hypothetical protein